MCGLLRSSYFGIVDLVGFPKDVYYMYQSERIYQACAHIFPHWNWTSGQTIDVWAYYNQADEVELYSMAESVRAATSPWEGDDLHATVATRIPAMAH